MEQHPKPAPAASERARAPTPASWRPGMSGNPRGRPPKGSALTDAIRAKVDVAELVDIAMKLARTGEAESTRISALNWLRDSGFTRPAERHEVGPVGAADAHDEDALADSLSDAELDALDKLEDERARILERARERTAPALLPDAIDVEP